MSEKHPYAKCKICGHHHRGVEHVWGAKPPADSVKMLASLVDEASERIATKPTKKRGRKKMEGPSTGKSPRAEYQRELMRKRLAEGKVKPKARKS